MNSLQEYLQKLRKLRTQLEDLNSDYPETAEFLRDRGLTNVRELDESGRAELVSHLQKCAGIHPA